MEQHGYETVMCNSTDFWCFQEAQRKIMDTTPRQFIRKIKKKARYLFDKKKNLDSKYFQDRMNLNRRPNLFYVGTKK